MNSALRKKINGARTITDYRTLTVIIPTINEASSIGTLLKMLASLYPGVRVIVADDGSTDGTPQIVKTIGGEFDKKDGAVVRLLDRGLEPIKGLTVSIIDALSCCETEYFVVMDGDLQHPPETIEEIFTELLGEADLVVAARARVASEWPLFRKWVSRFASALAQVFLRLTGVRTSDPMSGFFGGNTARVLKIVKAHPNGFEPKGYKFLFDLLRVGKREFRPRHVYYTFGARANGKSKFTAKHGLYFLRSFFRS